MLTIALLQDLASPAGAALLEHAELLLDDPFAAEKLRRVAPLALAAAAVDQSRLRLRAREKFRNAGSMWLTGPLLEQASAETVALHRAQRFQRVDGWIGDLCCGLGGDALGLAAMLASARASGNPERLVLVDRDPLALALASANLQACGNAAAVRRVCAALPSGTPRVEAAWVDPARRTAARTGEPDRISRSRELDRMSPPLTEVLALRAQIPDLGIKLSPAVSDESLNAMLAGIPHEREWLSVGGECRELAVWLGGLRRGVPAAGNGPVHRACLLPAGPVAPGCVLPDSNEISGFPRPLGPPRPASEWLLEPDAAVIRAGLVGNLAEQMNGWPIDVRLAYLSLPNPAASFFGKLYRIEAPRPFSGKALSQELRRREAGDVVLKTRGAAVQPEILRHQLRGVLKQGKSDCCPVVFLTRLAGRAVMILGERIGPGAE